MGTAFDEIVVTGCPVIRRLLTPPPLSPPSFRKSHLRKNARARCKAADAAEKVNQSQGNADAAGGDGEVELGAPYAVGSDTSEDAIPPSPPQKASPAVEVVLARLLTETLASLTREFERDALLSGEVRDATRMSCDWCRESVRLCDCRSSGSLRTAEACSCWLDE